MDIAHIYTLSDPRNGEIRYVGKTISLKGRKKSHFYSFSRPEHPKTIWVKELRALGLKPSMEVIETVHFEKDEGWEEVERFWISTFKFYGFKLLNCDDGGNIGKKVCEETKLKIKVACTLRMTPEERARLSVKSRLNRHTPETKKAIADSKLGKPRPVEVNAAFQAGCKDWKQSMGYRTTRFCVRCNEVIKYNFLKDGSRVPDLHFFTEGIGYIHNKCKKQLLFSNASEVSGN